MQFKIESETLAYQGVFQLKNLRLRHTLYQGGWSPVVSRELFQRGDCVAVVLYDPHRDTVVLIEQFRVGAVQSDHPWLLEIVGGAIEAGESVEAVAYREAEEESGCTVRKLIKIHEFYTTPGTASEKITLFCGLVDSRGVGGIHGLKEEGEDIRVEVLSLEAVRQKLVNNQIQSAIALVGLQWLLLNHERLGTQ